MKTLSVLISIFFCVVLCSCSDSSSPLAEYYVKSFTVTDSTISITSELKDFYGNNKSYGYNKGDSIHFYVDFNPTRVEIYTKTYNELGQVWHITAIFFPRPLGDPILDELATSIKRVSLFEGDQGLQSHTYVF